MRAFQERPALPPRGERSRAEQIEGVYDHAIRSARLFVEIEEHIAAAPEDLSYAQMRVLFTELRQLIQKEIPYDVAEALPTWLALRGELDDLLERRKKLLPSEELIAGGYRILEIKGALEGFARDVDFQTHLALETFLGHLRQKYELVQGFRRNPQAIAARLAQEHDRNDALPALLKCPVQFEPFTVFIEIDQELLGKLLPGEAFGGFHLSETPICVLVKNKEGTVGKNTKGHERTHNFLSLMVDRAPRKTKKILEFNREFPDVFEEEDEEDVPLEFEGERLSWEDDFRPGKFLDSLHDEILAGFEVAEMVGFEPQKQKFFEKDGQALQIERNTRFWSTAGKETRELYTFLSHPAEALLAPRQQVLEKQLMDALPILMERLNASLRIGIETAERLAATRGEEPSKLFHTLAIVWKPSQYHRIGPSLARAYGKEGATAYLLARLGERSKRDWEGLMELLDAAARGAVDPQQAFQICQGVLSVYRNAPDEFSLHYRATTVDAFLPLFRGLRKILRADHETTEMLERISTQFWTTHVIEPTLNKGFHGATSTIRALPKEDRDAAEYAFRFYAEDFLKEDLGAMDDTSRHQAIERMDWEGLRACGVESTVRTAVQEALEEEM